MKRQKGLLLLLLFASVVALCDNVKAQTPGRGGSVSWPGHGDLKSSRIRKTAQSTPLISLAELFAPPTQAEVDVIKAEWTLRTPLCSGWTVEAEGVIEGFTVKVVSHSNSGYKHYGIVRYPLNYTPGGSFPVLLFNHGALEGIDYEVVQFFDSHIMPGSFLEENFFFVIPSYRAESVIVRQLGTFLSEGDPSILDYDVDDVMALLDGVLDNIPEADPDRVAAYGYSRGGALILLLGCRDSRIARLVDLYGPTNWMTPELRQVAQMLINQRSMSPPQHLLEQLVMDHAVIPWYEGTLTLAEARLELIRRSPAFFVDMLPDLEFHHGTADDIVPVEHSDELEERLIDLGAAAPPFAYFRYPGGLHNVPSLNGCGAAVETYISALY